MRDGLGNVGLGGTAGFVGFVGVTDATGFDTLGLDGIGLGDAVTFSRG